MMKKILYSLLLLVSCLSSLPVGAQAQFGDEHLLDLLRHTPFSSARQVIELLSAEVEAHRQGAEPNDDLTMLCIFT